MDWKIHDPNRPNRERLEADIAELERLERMEVGDVLRQAWHYRWFVLGFVLATGAMVGAASLAGGVK